MRERRQVTPGSASGREWRRVCGGRAVASRRTLRGEVAGLESIQDVVLGFVDRGFRVGQEIHEFVRFEPRKPFGDVSRTTACGVANLGDELIVPSDRSLRGQPEDFATQLHRELVRIEIFAPIDFQEVANCRHRTVSISPGISMAGIARTQKLQTGRVRMIADSECRNLRTNEPLEP
jgi:hypothetical protein